MPLALFAAAAVGLMSTPAFAQNFMPYQVTAIAREVYIACNEVGRREGSLDPRAACACVTGYMAGAMSDRDFEVASVLLKVGEMTERGAAQSEIEAEILDFFQRGYTQDDVNRVAAQVRQIGARGDAVCSQFERETTS